MPQRELNHFSDFLDLVLETADVFVCYLRHSSQRFALFRYCEYRPLRNQNGVCHRADTKNLESQSTAKVGYHYVVALRHRDALESVGEVALVNWRNRLKRRDDDLLRGRRFDLLYRDSVSDCDARVVPDQTVDSYDAASFVRRVQRKALGNCSSLSFNLNNIASGSVQSVHGIIIDSRNASAYISSVGLKHLQSYALLAHFGLKSPLTQNTLLSNISVFII